MPRPNVKLNGQALVDAQVRRRLETAWSHTIHDPPSVDWSIDPRPVDGWLVEVIAWLVVGVLLTFIAIVAAA